MLQVTTRFSNSSFDKYNSYDEFLIFLIVFYEHL